jgi:Ca-activated chloride channel homolog
MTSHLELTHRLNVHTIPSNGQPRLLYLLLETNIIGEATAFAPVNLSLVVDASESMRIRLVTEAQFRELASIGLMQEVLTDGVPAWQMQNLPRALIEQFPRKLDFVIEALHAVAEELRPHDFASLVAFATQPQLLLPITSGKERQKLLAAIRAFASADVGDDTYLGRGMGLGHASMQSGSAPDRVNRMVLLTDGFTRDLADCQRWLAQARLDGTIISTVGVGDEFNEDLLIPLAEQTGGHAYFIHHPKEIPAIFRQELQAAQRISYRRSEMKLQLTPGVELRQVYRVKPVISLINISANQGGSYAIPLGNIEQDTPPSFLLEMIVPSRNNGRFRIAQVLLSSDPVGANRQTARLDIVIEFAPVPGAIDGYVMNIVERVTAFKLQTRALEEITNGDFGSATQKLQAAATRLLDMGEVELALAVERQANALTQQGQPDAEATKHLRYGTRRLTQRLA